MLPKSILAVALALTASAAQEAYTPDVPYVPTSDAAVQAMLKLAGVRKTDVVFDLGCGDGRIVIAAAKDFGAHGVGVEIDPKLVADARENARKAGVADRVRFEEGDLFQADIHEATVVALFLLNAVNGKLRPKLLQELRPGTRVVSNTFSMGDWKPDKTITLGDPHEISFLSHKLFLWTVPPHGNK